MTDRHRIIKMLEVVLKLIKAQPDNIVRCKDCKYYEQDERIPYGLCKENNMITEPDWFCADAEEDTG